MKNIILSRMAFKGITAKQLALKFGISEAEFSRKMAGERGWELDDLMELFALLGMVIMTEEEKDAYDIVRAMMKMGVLKSPSV